MDAVITYVNGNDPLWLKSYQEHVGGGIYVSQFRDYGTLKYIFRGIERFLPFIHRIHLIVSSDSQIPKWLNRDCPDLHIVFHDDFIPPEFLPTFNSNTIEMFLPQIEGLSEKFLYFNDDFFVTQPCVEEDFFVDGKPCITFMDTRDIKSMILQICQNSSNVANIAAFGPKTRFKGVLKPQHTIAPMLKDECLKCFEKTKGIITSTLSRVRKYYNVTQYLYTDYFYYTGNYYPQSIDMIYMRIGESTPDAISNEIMNPHHKTLCINDGADKGPFDFNEYLVKMIPAFEALFPTPSKYER